MVGFSSVLDLDSGYCALGILDSLLIGALSLPNSINYHEYSYNFFFFY